MIEITTFDSRPIYGRLSPDPRARHHLVVAEGEGAAAVLDAFADETVALSRTTLIYAEPARQSGRLESLGAAVFAVVPSRSGLLARLDDLLGTARMGTRLYAAGTESFVGEVIAKAAGFGVVPESVIAETRGSPARRVKCVHCRHVAEAVTVSPYVCPGCGQSLLVRDHFSRRLSAFQGVRIDAEVPGDIPPAMELVR